MHAKATTSDDALANSMAFAEVATFSVLAFLVAAILGIAVALVGRRRGLAPSWASLSLAPAALILLTVCAIGVPFAIGAPIASLILGFTTGLVGWAAQSHVEDRRAGADREIEVARRLRPLDGVRRRAADRRRRSTSALTLEVPIGRNARGELVSIPRGSAQSGAHVIVPGATGAGKTTSLAALLVEYVVRSRFGAIVIEAKNDAALLVAAERAAAAAGVPFRLVGPSGPCGYDPLARGSVDERSERLIAAQSWGSEDADFYRQAASPFLRGLLRVLDRASLPATLATVADRCDPDELENLASEQKVPGLFAEATQAGAALRADEKRAVAGLRARLRNLASSEFARDWLDPARPGVGCVDLGHAIRRREVVYLRLDTDRTGNVGRTIAQMALLDLGAVASSLMGEGVGTFVAIDEFGALEAPALDRLFTRGRAAGFSVALGTQTLADLQAAGPAVSERIAATVAAVICHRIGGQEDAEWVAQAIGAVPTWETTSKTNRLGMASGDGTRTRGYRLEVNPSELQRLGLGEAVVARLGDAGPRRSARVRVVPPWDRQRRRAKTCQETTGPPAARQEKQEMINVTMTATLTHNPHLEHHGETTVCEMRLADMDSGKDSPLYIKVVAFGPEAEKCATYLHKGRHVAVAGFLRFREWQGGDGAKRSEFSVSAQRVQFLPGGPRREDRGAVPAEAPSPSPAATMPAA